LKNTVLLKKLEAITGFFYWDLKINSSKIYEKFKIIMIMFENNPITKLFNIKYPLIQGGMAGISESKLV